MIANNGFIREFRRFKIVFTRGTISRRTWYPRIDTKKISVVLLRDSPGLGRSGDIVETSRGFANYHLIPRGLAAYANWYNIDLYSRLPAASDTHSPKDVASARSEPLSALSCPPHRVVFTGRLAEYSLAFAVKTFPNDTSRLVAPVSLFRVLDEFARRFNVDLVASQVSQIRLRGADSTLAPFDGADYISFSRTGVYDVLVNFPLLEDPQNSLEFTLELASTDTGCV